MSKFPGGSTMMLLASSYMDMVRATAGYYKGGEGVARFTNALSRAGVWYALVFFPVAAAVVIAIGIATTLLGV